MGVIVALVLMTALALPLAGLFFFRIYENQIIRQTEAELIGQAAVLAAVMRREVETALPLHVPLGAAVDAAPADPAMPYQPIQPALDLTEAVILGPRPPAQAPATSPDPAFAALGARLAPDLKETQRITLAGFRLLDPHGTVIAGGGEVGQSLAHVEEVAAALCGQFRSLLRMRISTHAPPPLYSLSRGTHVRVFVAMPVVVRGAVAGVVYAARTPSNVFKSFYQERGKVAAAGFTILAFAAVIGFIFQRTITRPIREMMMRTRAIGRGDRDAALAPLSHYGTAEFAALSQGFLDTAHALQNRSDFVATFAAHVSHELKSPLTAIQGAAELMRDDLDTDPGAMSREDRRRFLDNIIADTRRLTRIVQRLRDLARAESLPTMGTARLADVVAQVRAGFAALRIELAGDVDAPVRISAENARIVLSHLADNALRHGARSLTLTGRRAGDELHVRVRDDGAGISPANREKIFDTFFTTRRESGGTGMGLPIVRAMLEAHGGRIELEAGADESDDASLGASFLLVLPLSLAPISEKPPPKP